jgi:hypothetical protein
MSGSLNSRTGHSMCQDHYPDSAGSHRHIQFQQDGKFAHSVDNGGKS